jgi:hypothetical protein
MAFAVNERTCPKPLSTISKWNQFDFPGLRRNLSTYLDKLGRRPNDSCAPFVVFWWNARCLELQWHVVKALFVWAFVARISRIVFEFFKLGGHGRIAFGEPFDGQIFGFVVGQTEVIDRG